MNQGAIGYAAFLTTFHHVLGHNDGFIAAQRAQGLNIQQALTSPVVCFEVGTVYSSAGSLCSLLSG